MKLYKTLLFTLIVFYSCKEQERRNDVKYERYDDGSLKSIKIYEAGLVNGQAQWFYPNGTIEQIVMFKGDKENGSAYYFYRSGALKSHRYWQDGKMVGYVADYYDDTVGIIKSVLIYNNNGDLIYKKNFDSLGRFIGEEGKKPEQQYE